MLKIYFIAGYPLPSAVLIISSFFSFLWAITRSDENKKGEKVIEMIFQFIGFSWGVTTLVWGVYTLGSESYPRWVAWILIVVGLSLFLKPIKNIPWASLVSLLAASSLTALLAYNMSPISFFGFDLRWLLAIVFFSLLFTLYIILKFLEDLFKVVGIVLSSDPVSLIILQGCSWESSVCW